MRTKTCPRCKETKPIIGFGRSRHSADGLHCYCRVCATARTLEWARRNPEKARAVKQKYRQSVLERNKDRDPYADT